MKGLILVNAYAQSVNTRQVDRLRDELLLRGVQSDAMRNDGFFACVINGNSTAIQGYDFCIYLDKDKYASHILQKHMRLFNSAKAIEVCDDKMTTHIALSDNGIPMPDTVAGLLCYDKNAKVSDRTIDTVIQKLGLPVIVKQSFGSMGTGVFKADTKEQLKQIAARLINEPHLYQKFVASSFGKDMRVIVVGGKVLGGIIRKSDNDFRSNIGLGGNAVKTEVPQEVVDTATKAAKILGLDYCGMDFLLGETPLLCEVNSNAFFDAFENATNINVAGAYAEHIIKTMRSKL